MTPAKDASVELPRLRLRAELRRARAVAGLTQKEVAEAMDWSLSKLLRIESGSVSIKTNDLRVLLPLYHIDEPSEVDRIIGLARAGKQQEAWWTAYKEATSQQYLTYIELENSAAVIQQFQPLLIPGLLQDEEYARAVLRAYGGPIADERVGDWVDLRMLRQENLFERSDPPEMVFVLDEAALHRWVGGKETMRHQLQRLKKEAGRNKVTIEIVPFSAGEHPGMKGPMEILEFADERVEDVLFLENSRGDMISREETKEIKPYREAFAQLRDLASKTDLEAIIDKAIREMS